MEAKKTMTRVAVQLIAVLEIAILHAAVLPAAQGQKPVTNADLIEMVNNGFPEATIIGAIQANSTDFDVSAAGLIALQKAQVSQNLMAAMLASESNKRSSSSAPVAPAAPTATRAENASAAGLPFVNLMPHAALPGTAVPQITIRMSREKTQLAQTKSKASSLSALSKDNLLDEALQTGVKTAVLEGMMHSGSLLGSTAMGQTGGLLGGMLSNRRKQSLTYVWALPAPSSPTAATTDSPRFEVKFAGIPGVNPEEFVPVLVKLTATPNNWRLVGATEGKQDAISNPQLDWPMYSSFIEDRVPVRNTRLASGDWDFSPVNPLAAGDYGVVVRPVSKSKSFSGQDVGRNQGDGLLFNFVWPFAVK